MGRVNRKSTLSLKTRCRSPKTVAKRKFHLLAGNPLVKNVVSIAQNCSETQISFCRRTTLSSKTWCRSPKTVAKRKFHLLAGNPLVKNLVSIAQNCSKTLLCAKRIGRWLMDSYNFVHAAVAKRTFAHLGMHGAVVRRTFVFWWMNPLAGIGVSLARNCSETHFELQELLRAL